MYYIRGTSSSVGQQISFAIQFINDGVVTPSALENIYCDVDNNGNWEYEYTRKKIYSLERFLYNRTNILTCDFSAADDFGELTSLGSAFYGFAANSQGLTAVNFGTNKNDSKLTSINRMFRGTKTLQSVDLSMFTFANVNDAQGVFYVNTDIKSVDLSNATFANTTLANNFFGGATAMTSISMNAATFANLQECWLMFNGCSNVVTISLQSATFANLVNAKGMFSDCVKLETINWSNNLNLNKLEIVSDTAGGQPAMFRNCKKITNATIAAFASGQTFAALKQSREWFSGCTTLTAIDFADAIFDNVTTNSARWFEGCTALQSVSMANATFENAQVAAFMFNGCTALQSVDLRSAKFKSTTAFRNMFFNCTSLVTVRMDNCSGEASYENDNMFQNCNSLVNLSVGQNSTMPSLSASTSYGNINLAAAPLTYTSILGVANWVRDYTGGTAHTLTFKTSAWSALTAAEQATIQGILQAKNWNLATA